MHPKYIAMVIFTFTILSFFGAWLEDSDLTTYFINFKSDVSAECKDKDSVEQLTKGCRTTALDQVTAFETINFSNPITGGLEVLSATSDFFKGVWTMIQFDYWYLQGNPYGEMFKFLISTAYMGFIVWGAISAVLGLRRSI